MRLTAGPLLLLLLLGACTPSPPTSEPESPDSVSVPEVSSSNAAVSSSEAEPTSFLLEPALGELTFEDPLYMTFLPENGSPLVVERTGRIYLIEDDEKTIFLDLSEQVDASGQEQGLLGLALDPKFEENGFFYVNYTADSQTFISRFTAFEPTSEEILLSFEQPYANHNGGHLAFGPDGYLYIASGDGGSGGDPHYHAQNQDSLLGKLLRIDVSGESSYTIPEDNLKEEVFAYGLRNPWRFSFDKETGTLWAADVGQNSLEEINIIENGLNYGWNVYEGSAEYDGAMAMEGMRYKGPIWEYDHSQGRSITGGYV